MTQEANEDDSHHQTASKGECQDPNKLNEGEIMQYYSLNGVSGRFRMRSRLFRNYILQKLAADPIHPKMTIAFQRMRGVNIGSNVYIGPHVHLDFLYPGLITIEDHVSIGMHCMIFCHSNPTCSIWLKTHGFPRKVAPVTIKEGAWVPPGTIILPGVIIGEHSIVGAGSIVNRDVDPFTMVAGHPARLIRRLK